MAIPCEGEHEININGKIIKFANSTEFKAWMAEGGLKELVDAGLIELPGAEPAKKVIEEGPMQPEVVAISKEFIEPEMIEKNLSEEDKLFISSSDPQAFENAKKLYTEEPDYAQNLIDSIVSGEKKSISDTDPLVLLLENARLAEIEKNLNKQRQKAIEDNDVFALANIEIQRETLIEQQKKVLKAIDFVGSTAGKTLRHMGVMATTDMTFAGLTHEAERSLGRKLEKQEKAKYKKIAEDYADLKKQYDELIEKQKEAFKNARKEAEKEILEKYRKEIEEAQKKKTYTKKAKEIADYVRTFKNKPFELKDENGNPIDIKTMGFTMNDLIEGIAKSIEKWGSIADGIAEYLSKAKWYNDLSPEGKKSVVDQLTKRFSPEVKEKTKTELDYEFNSLAEDFKEQSEGVVHEGLFGITQKMLKNRVEKNIDTTIDEVVNDIYEAVKDEIPDVEKEEIRDLLSGYGKYKKLTEDQVKLAMAEIKLQGRLDAKIEATEAGELPLRNGFERKEKTEDTLTKEAIIAKNIKEKNLVPPPTAEELKQVYKSREQTLNRTLDNEITRLEEEIRTGVLREKSTTQKITSEEIERKRKRIEQLREIRDAKFKSPAATELEKLVKKAVKAGFDAETAKSSGNKETERQKNIEKDLTENAIGNLVNFLTPNAPELKKLVNKNIELTKKIGEAKKAKDSKTERELQIEKELTENAISNLVESVKPSKTELEKLVLQAKNLTEKIGEAKKKQDKKTEEQLKIEKDLTQGIIRNLTEAADPVEARVKAKIKAMEKAIKDIRLDIATIEAGETIDKPISVKKKDGKTLFKFTKEKKKLEDQRIDDLENIKAGLEAELSNLLPDAVKNKAIIDKELKSRERRLQKLEQLLEAGKTDKSVFAKKVKEEKPITKEIETINLKIKKLEDEVWQEKQKIEKENKSFFKKSIDRVMEVLRFQIFANPWGVGRLAYAAIYRPFVTNTPSEIAKYILSNAPITRRIFQKAPTMYRPTIGSTGRAIKNYYVALTSKKTFKNALSEYNSRGNFSLLYEPREPGRYEDLFGSIMAKPEQTHGWMKAFPKEARLESSYQAALENMANMIDPVTGEFYDILDPRVQQAAITAAIFDAKTDVFMAESEVSKATNNLLNGLAESKNAFLNTIALTLKQQMPVLKVPPNFYYELVQQLPGVGLLDAAIIVARSGKKGEGYRGISNLTPEEASKAAKALVNQAVGLMILGFGMWLYEEYGDAAIHFIEEHSYWFHNTGHPLIEMGLEIGKDMKEKPDEKTKAVFKETAKTGVKEFVKLPQIQTTIEMGKLGYAAQKEVGSYFTAHDAIVRKKVGQDIYDKLSMKGKKMLAALMIPSGSNEWAKRMDDMRQRDPQTFEEILKARIPWLREQVRLRQTRPSGATMKMPGQTRSGGKFKMPGQ
jgi:hypothetical protein